MLTPSEAYKAGTTMVFRTDDARSLLNWKPVISYEQGVRLTLEYEHRKLLRQAQPVLQSPSLLWWLLILGGMWLCLIGDAAAAAADAAAAAGSSDCGLPLHLCRVVVFGRNAFSFFNLSLSSVFWLAMAAHAVEAAIALLLIQSMRATASVNGIVGHKHCFGWSGVSILAYVLQTLALGYPSLKIILRYMRLQRVMLESGVMRREASKLPLL
jgi:hypothetical protein